MKSVHVSITTSDHESGDIKDDSFVILDVEVTNDQWSGVAFAAARQAAFEAYKQALVLFGVEITAD